MTNYAVIFLFQIGATSQLFLKHMTIKTIISSRGYYYYRSVIFNHMMFSSKNSEFKKYLILQLYVILLIKRKAIVFDNLSSSFAGLCKCRRTWIPHLQFTCFRVPSICLPIIKRPAPHQIILHNDSLFRQIRFFRNSKYH